LSQKKCESCSGTGIIPLSWGLGNIKCPSCNGTGCTSVNSEKGAFVLHDPKVEQIAKDQFWRSVEQAIVR
jgi:DnaJ-class molecular chaperone